MRILLRIAALLALAGGLAGLGAQVAAQTAGVLLPPDWIQLGTRGVDAAAGEDGRRWMAGSDGRVRRFDAANARWDTVGTRSDFARVDASRDGAAALTRGGELFVIGNGAQEDWRPTGMRAADVGMARGRIWLADARFADGRRAVASAAFDAAAPMQWNAVEGRLVRIDVDSQGRPWGLDAQGRLFVLAESGWIADTTAPPASDVAVGGNGTVIVVARQVDERQGGGSLHARDPRSGAWSTLPGRAVAISADPDGRVFGVNSLSWVIAATGEPIAGRGGPAPGSDPAAAREVVRVRLAELAPEGVTLPESLADVTVAVRSGTPAASSALLVGETTLNGLPTTVLRYMPSPGAGTNLLLVHGAFTLGDYVPELRDTGAGSWRFTDVVVSFVPAANAGFKARPADVPALVRAAGITSLAEFAPPAGTAISAVVDLAVVPGGSAAARMLGLDANRVSVQAGDVDGAMFRAVRESRTPPAVVEPVRTLEDLARLYGERFAEGLAFTAPASALDGRAFGPARLKAPAWRFALSRGESSVGLSVALSTGMELAVATSGAGAGAARGALDFASARVTIDPLGRSARLDGTINSAASARVEGLKDLSLGNANVSGLFALAEGKASITGLDSLAALDLELAASGRMPSRAGGAGAPVDVLVALNLNEARDAVVPSLRLSGSVTLADIVGSAMPGADRVKLTQVEWTPGTLAGTASLYGLPVRSVLHQGAGMAAPIIGLMHRELDLGSYIPAIRGTNIGSFGLANAVFYILPESAQPIAYNTRSDMPEALASLLDRKGLGDLDPFPLTLRPGVNVIGMWGAKGENEVDDGGVAGKVKAIYGIEDKAYIVKGNFKASALANARLENGPERVGRRTVTARQVACAVAPTGNNDSGGLDLSIPLPDFSPPYAAGRVRFSNATFALKEVDGQLEPSIVTSMAFNLARTAGDLNDLARHVGAPASLRTGGVNQVGLAAKVRVKGDLNTLCNGVKPDSSYEIGFAGATALNLADVGTRAFDALEKVTRLDAPEAPAEGAAAPTPPATPADPLAAALLELARKTAENMRRAMPPERGWKPAFGLPFLEVRKLAVAGTFGQADGKRTLTGTVWTSSTLGSEAIDVLGSLSLEAEVGTTDYKLSDWLLRLPGPVRLTGLPGVSKLAGATPHLELGDFTLANLELTPKLMTGDLRSASRNLSGTAVIIVDPVEGGEPDVQVFAGVNRFAPNLLLKPASQLPPAPGDLTLGRTLFGIRAGNSANVKLEQLPPAVARLFTRTVGDLVDADTSIPLVRGISVAGRVNPGEIPARPEYADIKGLLDTLELDAPIPIFGGVELSQGAGGVRSFLEAWLPATRIPGVPQGELRLANTRVSLASLDGRALRVDTDIRFVPPASLASAIGRDLNMRGLIEYTRATNGDTSITVSGTSDVQWNPSLGISNLSFGNVGLEWVATRSGAQRNRTLTLLSDATFRGLAARARLGLTSDGSGRGGTLLELVAREEGQLLSLDTIVNALPLLPSGYNAVNLGSYMSLGARGILVATEAGSGRVSLSAEDVRGNINGQTFSGQLAIAGISSANPVMFIANDAPWTPARIFPAAIPKGPFADLALPEGLVILSPVKGDANVSALHPRIYDKVFAKLFGAREAARVLMEAGLTVVARVNLTRNLPPAMATALAPVIAWLPESGDMVIGGGVQSGGGLAFYADVQGLSLPIPAPFSTFISSTSGHVTLFFRTAGASGAGTEVGIASDVRLGVPRLDQPATVQRVDATLSLSSVTAAGTSPSLAVAVTVPGTWPDPAGLDGFSLTDTSVSIGASGAGTTVGIATNRAQFRDSGGTTRAFALDLQTAWAGGAPTQLSVQFAKSPDTAELVVSPALQAELANSVLQLALKSGSALAAAVVNRINTQTPPVDAAARTALTTVGTMISQSASGAMALMRNSPLSMIGVRNPVVYFVTPGNDLPDRPGIDRPPFGLGLEVKGDLLLTLGGASRTIGSGQYRINLRDGFYVSGTVTPPQPFSLSTFTLAGMQPLGAPAPVPLTVSGSLALPGGKLLGKLDASLSGTFSVIKPLDIDSGADVSAQVSIGGLGSRSAYLTLSPDSVRVYSAPDGGCTELPVKLDGTLSWNSLADPAALLGIAQPTLPDPIKCATQFAQAVADAGKAVGGAIVDGGQIVAKWARSIGSSPPRASYDCANLEDPKFGAENPPGRIWIARDEYTQGASSGAFARYIFSTADMKFRPIGARSALGATACGGLVGVEGVGLGRFAGDEELWSKALTCNFIPESLKGASVNNAQECYAARGVSAPRPDLAGKLIVAQGDTSNTTYFVAPDGTSRFVGGGGNWGVYEACQLNADDYPPVRMPLDELYRIPLGAAMTSGDNCRTVMGSYWRSPARPDLAGKFIIAAGDNTSQTQYFITPDGVKHLAGGGNNWGAYNDCGLTPAGYPPMVLALAALRRIPEGEPMTSGDNCRAMMGSYWKPHARAGQVVAYDCGNVKNTYIVTREGRKLWIANKDNWSVYEACGRPAIACIGAPEVAAMPTGTPIDSGDVCVQTIQANGGNGGDSAWTSRICQKRTQFDVAWYLQRYPDVLDYATGVADSQSALATTTLTGTALTVLRISVRNSKEWKDNRAQAGRDHWNRYGRFERVRQPNPYFSAPDYAARYGDLQGYANDSAGAYDHWVNHGCFEGRNGAP